MTWPSGKSKSDTSSFSDEIEHFHSIVVHEQPSSTTTASDSSLHVHADNGNVSHYGVHDHDHTPIVQWPGPGNFDGTPTGGITS